MDFVGIDKFSLLDFDGYVCATLFAPKCNFRCPFCHNGQSVLESTTSIPFEDILSYLNSRKGVIDAVTITGGEPTLMEDLTNKIIVLRNLGLKIKLDTNGTNPVVLKSLLDNNLLDYVAMDIKNSEAMYATTCGVHSLDFNKIKESISLIMNSNIDYEFRTTIVNEFHSASSINEMGKLIQGSKRLFLQKFVDRDGCIKRGLHDISINKANEYKQILLKYVSSVELRGY